MARGSIQASIVRSVSWTHMHSSRTRTHCSNRYLQIGRMCCHMPIFARLHTLSSCMSFLSLPAAILHDYHLHAFIHVQAKYGSKIHYFTENYKVLHAHIADHITDFLQANSRQVRFLRCDRVHRKFKRPTLSIHVAVGQPQCFTC